MTKCAHCVWNPQKHKNIVSNAQNWKVHEINSKSTLIMTTYSRVVSWMSRRLPLCSSTSWRSGSASAKRVFQGPEKLYILYNYGKYILSEKSRRPLRTRPLQTMGSLFNPLYQKNRRLGVKYGSYSLEIVM